MCILCDSTNIKTIIEFVPNCLQHVSVDGFNGGSDSYLQFRDTCGKRRNINLILDITPQKEIAWGCIWRTRCIVYDKLLKPRQSFRTTLYVHIFEIHVSLYRANRQQQQYATFSCTECSNTFLRELGRMDKQERKIGVKLSLCTPCRNVEGGQTYCRIHS